MVDEPGRLTAADIRAAIERLRTAEYRAAPLTLLRFSINGPREMQALREWADILAPDEDPYGLRSIDFRGYPIAFDAETPAGVLRALYSNGTHRDVNLR